MKPAPFVHHVPRSVDEAVAVLADVGHDGKVLAGGQSLVPILNMRLATPGHLVDINRVAGLDAIDVADGWVRVGALVRHRALERSEEGYAAQPVLRAALRCVAHPAIRNRGTTVGSLAHADAAGEMPSMLALTDGVVEVVSAHGAREVSWRDFFVGPLETSLQVDELCVAARFGCFAPGTGVAFLESARRQGDYALAGVGVAVTVTDGVVSGARASFVSVTDVPSVLDLMAALGPVEPGSAAWDAALDDVVDAVREHVTPEADIHASADYRRMLAAELTKRALTQASIERAIRDTPAPPPPIERAIRDTSADLRAASDAAAPSRIALSIEHGAATRASDASRIALSIEPGAAVSAGDAFEVTVSVNGRRSSAVVPARRLLSDFLRHDLGLTGTHVGCEHGVCGACTVLVDGEPMRSCLMFAVSAQGHEVTTVEGLGTTDAMSPVQQAFADCHGLQCGFCTPGFLTTVTAYLDENPMPTEAEAREAISGNLCRCTGYQNIVKSVCRAAQIRAEAQGLPEQDSAERHTGSLVPQGDSA